MLFPVNRASAAILSKIARAPRLGALDIEWTAGWHESGDRQRGFFERRPTRPGTWEDVILQGPNITVGTPLYKETRSGAKSNVDYDELDLESLDDDFLPQTVYQRAKPTEEYRSGYPKWHDRPSSEYFRLAWREMADPATVRTLQPALLHPGPTHLYTLYSLSLARHDDLVVATGICTSIIADFLVKATSSAHINISLLGKIPHVRGHVLGPKLVLRTLRLNCLVRPYAPLWSELYSPDWQADRWVPGVGVDYTDRTEIGDVTPVWERTTPLRRAADRRQALVEIDAIVAVMLGLTADELVTIYRTQFPVLQQYERRARYDSNGRELPADLAKELDKQVSLGRKVHTLQGPKRTYVGPFYTVDRERDLRLAHEHFSRIAAQRQAAASADGVAAGTTGTASAERVSV
ncbi:MAG: hypothetical protein IRZ08_07895 [Frankia sp.]|nr:hypothetical protein [Frankia sp.]